MAKKQKNDFEEKDHYLIPKEQLDSLLQEIYISNWRKVKEEADILRLETTDKEN